MREDKIFKNLQKEILDTILKFATKIALIIEREVVEVIDEKKIIATADLKKSISHRVEQTTLKTVIEVFSGMKYAVYVHEGTKPHFPPISAIKRWIIKKGIIGMYKHKPTTISAVKKAYFKGGKSKERSTKFVNDVNSIAWAIAKSISKKGTKAVPFLKLGLAQALPRIESEIRGFAI